MTFKALKRSRKEQHKALTAEVEKINSPSEYAEDERYWKPTVDKAKNGFAIIRFLPAPDGEDLPFVRYWDHFFKGPTGKWYVENSLTTLGQADPVSEYNSELWNTDIEANKEIARKQKRRLKYVANILVVKDSACPTNEGKVFLYQFGKKVFDKLNDAMSPQFEDEKPMNPFDMWDGADFKLKIRQVEGFRNYDASEFATPAAIDDDDNELEKIYKLEYSLAEIIAPDKFKTYQELKTKFDMVLGRAPGGTPALSHQEQDVDEYIRQHAGVEDDVQQQDDPPWDTDNEAKPSTFDDDDDLAEFQRLADEDD
tara:strand:+ start:542 stop:1474 length:933 start_codon:yes stop_codon:yes gene_type:complete